MRDYSNMPVLDWSTENAPLKAKAQIMHEEPIILQMPAAFDTTLEAGEFACKLHDKTGILYDIEGSRVLGWLATRNHEPDLNIVADACACSSFLVDIDSSRRRLIVHD